MITGCKMKMIETKSDVILEDDLSKNITTQRRKYCDCLI